MDRKLFESLAERAKDFASRAELGEDVRVEVWLNSGRVFLLERVVEAGDSHVQIDAWDPGADDQRVSIALPYYQINHLLMMPPKAKQREAGFRMRLG